MPDFLSVALGGVESGDMLMLNHLNRAIETHRAILQARVVELGFWYVDIPRTSSTFIKNSLAERFGYPCGKTGTLFNTTVDGFRPLGYGVLLPDHTPAFIAEEILGEAIWQRIETVTVVRNPYDWCWSLWRYVEERYDLGFSRGSLSDFLVQLSANTARPIIGRKSYPSDFLQSDYVLQKNGNASLVKRILRFEDRDAISEFLSKRGVVTGESYFGAMASASQNRNLSISEKSLIHNICAKDFDLFGY